ncbi:MAG: DNA recombination protein RmuC, partial [Bacteroidota bacterium]
MEIIYLLVGIIMGAGAAWFIARGKFQSAGSQANAQLLIEKDRVEQYKSDLNEVKQNLETERKTVIQLNSKLSSTEADYRNLQEKLKGQKEELDSLQQKFAFEFKSLANDIFEEKSKKFTNQNKVNLNELLNPLKERISEFEKKVETSSKESLEQSTALREQLKSLRELNQQMSKEAENLTKALKGDTKAQGNWGEFILESILEKSGLEKGREYFVQESHSTEEGKRFQP